MREHVIGTIGTFSPPREGGYCISCGLSKVEIEASDDKACHGGEPAIPMPDLVVQVPEDVTKVLANYWNEGTDAKP